MTFKILTVKDEVIHRASARSAMKGDLFPNVKADEKARNLGPPKVVTVTEDKDEDRGDNVLDPPRRDVITSALKLDPKGKKQMPTIDATNLLGRIFITRHDNDGKQHRTTVYNTEDTHETTPDGEKALYRFRCKAGDKAFVETITYGATIEWCNRDLHQDTWVCPFYSLRYV